MTDLYQIIHGACTIWHADHCVAFGSFTLKLEQPNAEESAAAHCTR